MDWAKEGRSGSIMRGGIRGMASRWTAGLLLLLAVAAAEAGEEPAGLPPPRVIDLPSRTVPGALPPPAPAARPPTAAGRPALAPAPAPAEESLVDGEVVGGPSGPEDPPPRPDAPPPRPTGSGEPRPEDFVFSVDPEGGTIRPYPDGDGRIALVMIGNPTIRGFAHTRADGQAVDELWIKANRVVAWVDLSRIGSLDVFGGLQGETEEPAKPRADTPPATESSVIQDAILGIYAEGAVELVYGDLAFRATKLHLEPRTFQALLIQPRFTGQTADESTGEENLPLYVRARQARLVAKGVAVFDDADVSVSRAHDRMELRVTRLTVSEDQEAPAEDGSTFGRVPSLMGFRRINDQNYSAEGVQFRGERIPLAYVGRADFEYPFAQNFPVRFRDFTTGQRSSQGRYATVVFEGDLGPSSDPLFTWGLALGGYSERGPAGGITLDWDKRRTRGKLKTWNIYEFGGKDQSGFVPPYPSRWLVELETRNQLTKKLQFDLEFNAFSDRGVNLEYFQADAQQHKDRESYGRLRWQEDFLVATATGKWHQRPFKTETTQLPQVAVWTTAIPILTARRKGGLGVDFMTRTQLGRLERRHDDLELDLGIQDYGANRFESLSTINLGFDAGDARFSAFGGLDAATYWAPSGTASSVDRTALVAGANVNLQLHRTFPVQGGFFQLQRLRHVIDLDAGFAGRYLDDTPFEEAPRFDWTDVERDRSQGRFRVRNRLQTRRRGGGIRDVLDLWITYEHYVDDKAPWLQRSPGAVEVYLRGEPRPGFYVAGEGDWNLAFEDFDQAFLGAGVRHDPDLDASLGVTYVRNEAIGPVADVSWRFSEKYGVRIRQAYDFDRGENRTRVVFGRYSVDHAFIFGVSARGDDVAFQFNFLTTLGPAGVLEGRSFNDEPNPNPWGLFQ